jgi:hypothetical protein
MAFSKQDFINFFIGGISAIAAVGAVIVGIAALKVANKTYEDREAINKLAEISNNQQIQLIGLDSSITLLDSQLHQIDAEIDLQKLQTKISTNQDQRLFKILGKLDSQIALSGRAIKFSNKIELFKRKSENSRLAGIYNDLLALENIFGYPTEIDTAKMNIFLAAVRPIYDRCLQNTLFAENEELYNELVNFNNMAIGFQYYVGKTIDLEKTSIKTYDDDRKKYRITSQVDFLNYRIKSFSTYFDQEREFRRKLGEYTDRNLQVIRKDQTSE